ncbi:MAG: GNAT family N-acetyltransferase, partial [Dehalococcoidia bacterium]
MEIKDTSTAAYPKSIDLNGEEIWLQLMKPENAAELHDFFVGLPPQDLLFLQRDVTDGREIDAWIREIENGDTVTLLARSESGAFLVGQATLRHNRVAWTRHVGSVQVVMDAVQRGRGLGRLLLQEIFDLAAHRGVEKIVAEMTVEQAPAMKLFERLGFREEGRYRAFVKDLRGVPHDLIVMTYDQPALAASQPRAEVETHPWRCMACGHVTTTAESLSRCPDCGASGENLIRVEQTENQS